MAREARQGRPGDGASEALAEQRLLLLVPLVDRFERLSFVGKVAVACISPAYESKS